MSTFVLYLARGFSASSLRSLKGLKAHNLEAPEVLPCPALGLPQRSGTYPPGSSGRLCLCYCTCPATPSIPVVGAALPLLQGVRIDHFLPRLRLYDDGES